MSGGQVGVLVATVLAVLGALVSLIVAGTVRRSVRELRACVDDLCRRAIPLVEDAHMAVGQASSELTRVGDVLGAAEGVTATVDSASRLAYRAFSNPVVKTLAFGSGLKGALARL